MKTQHRLIGILAIFFALGDPRSASAQSPSSRFELDELYRSFRTVVRLDLGDTVIRHRSQGPPCRDCTSHTFRRGWASAIASDLRASSAAHHRDIADGSLAHRHDALMSTTDAMSWALILDRWITMHVLSRPPRR